MMNAQAMHPVFESDEATPELRLMTAEEMQEIDGGDWRARAFKWGIRAGWLAGGIVGAAVGAALVGGFIYAVTH